MRIQTLSPYNPANPLYLAMTMALYQIPTHLIIEITKPIRREDRKVEPVESSRYPGLENKIGSRLDLKC